MVTIETVFGYGYIVPRYMVTQEVLNQKSSFLMPMCHTCGQSPYFFGIKIDEINSRSAYKKMGKEPYLAGKAKVALVDTLRQEYIKLFSREPFDNTSYVMFTDIKRG